MNYLTIYQLLSETDNPPAYSTVTLAIRNGKLKAGKLGNVYIIGRDDWNLYLDKYWRHNEN